MNTRAMLHVCLLLSLLSGCGGVATPIAPTAQGATKASFRVALLLPRLADADSWTREGYAGLLLIQQELGADIAYTENIPEADFEKVFRQYASAGYDFIIGHGAQFVPAAEKVATEFPHTAFAVMSKYGGNNANLGALSLREGEMSYLFGAIAAMKTRTKHVAFLGGTENANSREITALFERGVQATDPTVQVTIAWVGNFTDTAKAQQLAQDQINAGADIIFVLAGMAGTNVHAQAQKAGIFTLGWIEDLHSLAPNAVLTSNVQDVPDMLLYGARLAKQGRWEGKQYRLGMAEGAQHLAPFYGLMSPEEERKIEAIKNDLLTGKIDTTQ